MTNLAAELATALQNEVNKMNAQERVCITITVKMEKEKEPIDKTDWLSMARTYLPAAARVAERLPQHVRGTLCHGGRWALLAMPFPIG